MTTVAILFWAGVFLVFYTYLGYGILLWLLVKIREAVHPARRYAFPADPPEVTLLIAAYNGRSWRKRWPTAGHWIIRPESSA